MTLNERILSLVKPVCCSEPNYAITNLSFASAFKVLVYTCGLSAVSCQAIVKIGSKANNLQIILFKFCY